MNNVRLERRGSASLLTISREKALNALNRETMDEISAAIREASAGPSATIIITGAGDRSFCAGADISEMADLSASKAEEHARRGQAVMDLIANSPKVTVAAVNGYALGGGLELALACDIRIASDNAQMGLPEVSLGVIPGFGGTQRLPRIVGEARAMQMILTGEKIPAAKALEWGLVTTVTTREKLLDEAQRISDAISVNGPRAVAYAREAIRRGMEMTLSEGLAFEQKAFGLCFATSDQKEGMKAFLEKRKPSYEGK